MTKEREPKRPKVGSTPITPITAEESRTFASASVSREKLRQRYPDVHGRAVDYISQFHGGRDAVSHRAFRDRTTFSLRFAEILDVFVSAG